MPLQYLQHLFYVFNLTQLVHYNLNLAAVVHPYLNLSVEYTLIALDGDTVYVDVELVRYNLRHVVQHTLAVDSSYLYSGIEEHHLVHIPLGIQYALAVCRLQFGSHLAVAAVYLDAVLVVDKAQYVVARNRVAACREYILADILLVDIYRFLLVEAFANGEKVVLLVLLLLLFAEERDKLAPSAAIVRLLLVQLFKVFVAKNNGALAYSKEEVVVLLVVVKLA